MGPSAGTEQGRALGTPEAPGTVPPALHSRMHPGWDISPARPLLANWDKTKLIQEFHQEF